MINKNKTSIMIILGIVLFLSLFVNVNAETKLNWENPNSTGQSNPYRFKFTDVVNSQTMVQVVGCTGVVNKVSEAIMGLFQSDAFKEQVEEKAEEVFRKYCATLKISAGTAAGGAPMVDINDGVLTEEMQCMLLETADEKTQKQLIKSYKQQKQENFREECLNGIAITLAKNQLTSMTRSTMNWVATGFGGDPMYVRNMQSFIGSLEDRIVNEELELLQNADPNAYPYSRDFARGYYNSYTSEKNFKDSMSQTLTRHFTDGKTIEDYTYDFSAGGWEAWLGLTQESQNNPIGYAIETSNHISSRQQEEVENTKQELVQGNGIFNQKKCVEYKILPKYHFETGQMTTEEKEHTAENCVKWENISPGSVIQDKISTYINSPERQLELADTINEGLNALFSALIDKYRQSGLTGIGSSLGTDYADYSGGYGSNSSKYSVGSGLTDIGVDSAGYNRPFNLITDLGNTYIRSKTTEIGKWDASNNILKDANGVAIKDEKNKNIKIFEGSGTYDTTTKTYTGTPNLYYTVTTAGKTKLFNYGSSNWEVGDRAFWDGEKWQNWKKKTSNKIDLPIEKRGVIQIQEDYIVASRELLTVLPGVMPRIGELDYCIPGPNPNWEAYSMDTYDKYTDIVNNITTRFVTGKNFLQSNRSWIIKPEKNSKQYLEYFDLFTDSGLWDDVENTYFWTRIMGEDPLQTLHSFWGGSEIERANSLILSVKKEVLNSLDATKKQYKNYIEENYGPKSPMQTEYTENEKTLFKSKNPAYLGMVKEGLNITKNIVSYDEQIDGETKTYQNEIINLDSNIYQLNLIKKRVNEIISDAQKRRDENRELILKEIQEVNNVSRVEAEKIYAECSEQEKVMYLEADDIIGISSERDRCTDGLDNDLDGYIDQNDIDCNGSGNKETGRSRSSGAWNPNTIGVGLENEYKEEQDENEKDILEVRIIE